jgi:putative endonuclease
MSRHYVYILRCADDSLYTGYATDIEKRLREHNGEINHKAAARYTRGRRPVFLVYTEQCSTRSEALKRECAIKALTRTEKLLLIKLFNNNISNEVS